MQIAKTYRQIASISILLFWAVWFAWKGFMHLDALSWDNVLAGSLFFACGLVGLLFFCAIAEAIADLIQPSSSSFSNLCAMAFAVAFAIVVSTSIVEITLMKGAPTDSLIALATLLMSALFLNVHAVDNPDKVSAELAQSMAASAAHQSMLSSISGRSSVRQNGEI